VLRLFLEFEVFRQGSLRDRQHLVLLVQVFVLDEAVDTEQSQLILAKGQHFFFVHETTNFSAQINHS